MDIHIAAFSAALSVALKRNSPEAVEGESF